MKGRDKTNAAWFLIFEGDPGGKFFFSSFLKKGRILGTGRVDRSVCDLVRLVSGWPLSFLFGIRGGLVAEDGRGRGEDG